MHKRTAIRTDLAARMQALSGSIAGLLVARQRHKPLAESAMPIINVQTGSEKAARNSDAYRDIRTLDVAIIISAQTDEEVADDLDDVAELVEAALGLVPTLDDLVERFEYTGMTPSYAEGAAVQAASLRLEYECDYLWQPTPDVVALATVHVDIDMASPRNNPQTPTGPDGQIDASDHINLPTT